MHLISHPQKLPVVSVETGTDRDNDMELNNLLPSSIRSIICGPSGCGKTNAVLSLLYDKNGVKYENVYIFSKSLHQPKYIQLENVLNQIPEIGFFKCRDNNDIIPLEEVKRNSIYIFDDIACEKQDNIKKMFAHGRHSEVSCFLITQTYSSVSKQLIRDNTNFIIIFKQDGRNLLHLYHEHVSPDVTFRMFLDMCKLCWEDPFGFLVIDKTKSINNGRYRKGFDKLIIP
jgi:GTPase SAR1 family protein